MCGRATLSVPAEDLREEFDLVEVPELTPRWNIAPAQQLAVIKKPGHLELALWNPKMVNSMVERATSRPELRCLVVFDGFYEWQKVGPKAKQPHLFRRADGRPFLVGGVLRSDGTAAVATAPAERVMLPIHDRQPVVLRPTEWDRWLAGERLAGSLEGMLHFPVSNRVSNWRNDDATLVEPLPS
jgi:putative SOS response-associated peptidase YedK